MFFVCVKNFILFEYLFVKIKSNYKKERPDLKYQIFRKSLNLLTNYHFISA